MKKLTPDQRALAEGYRSGLEDQVSDQLREMGVPFSYEANVVHYIKPARVAKYTPDFLILNNGIIVETKGRFVTEDRQKHLLIKAQHPDLDIRFVFSNPNTRIAKKSPTTYAMWADRHGFPYAKQRIPADWIAEPADPSRIAALERAGVKPKV